MVLSVLSTFAARGTGFADGVPPMLPAPPAEPLATTLTLDSLEDRIDSAPALEAARTQVLASGAFERSLKAKNGFLYEASNAFGPRSDIIFDGLNNNTLRYSQRAGVRVPLLGERLSTAVDVTNADQDVLLADITVAEQRRDRLSALRTAFVLYWQSDRDAAIATRYLAQQQRLLPSARALRRDGFWTMGNFADYLDATGRIRRDVTTFEAAGRAAFAQMQSTIGGPIAFAPPQDPNLRLGCTPDRDRLVDAAVRTDPESLAYDAHIADVEQLLTLVKYSTVDASIGIGVGAEFDIPRGIGYDVTAGIDLSLPQHMRLEEGERRQQLLAQKTSYEQLEAQRRADLAAGIDKALADYAAAADDERAAKEDVAARAEDEREVVVRNRDLEVEAPTAFADLETRITESYAAEREVAGATDAVFMAGNAVITLVPNACRMAASH